MKFFNKINGFWAFKTIINFMKYLKNNLKMEIWNLQKVFAHSYPLDADFIPK